MKTLSIAAALLAAGAAAAQQAEMDHSKMEMDMDAPPPTVQVRVDSVQHIVFIKAGPFDVHGMAMGMTHHTGPDHVFRIAWPVDGYLDGYAIAIEDSAAKLLPREMIHHAGLANLERRELLLPMLQRVIAASKETAPVQMPVSIGMPLQRGDSLALYAGLHSPSGASVSGAYVTYRLPYAPATRGHHPQAVWPMHFLVGFVPGGPAAFDLPPGRSEFHADYIMPVNGHLLVAGGHVHDYAVSMKLVDCQSGKTLVKLMAHRRKDGTVSGLDRFVFGFHYDALKLEKGHCYRVIATYDNPTGHVIVDGGMGSIGGPVQVDDLRDWPALERQDPRIVLDVSTL